MSSLAESAPRVSVVVPVRNDPDNLRICLTALQSSTIRDFEVLVIDDGSTDNTASVAQQLGATVHSQPSSGGPARARNRGAELARGEIVFFVDADVRIHPDTIEQFLRTFDDQPDVAAVFGSYDTDPGSPALIAQYKNLFHHFVHQQSSEEAGTFWSGCGAVRREMFRRLGGFDAGRYERPCIEDIDLGMRLRRAGHRIVLNKAMQGSHLKRWTLGSLIRSDVFDRGVPWTHLILEHKDLPADLNLGWSQRISAVLAGLLVLGWLATCWYFPSLAALPVVVYALIVLADAWTARRAEGRGVAARMGSAAMVVLAVIALVGLGYWLREWGLAMALPLLGLIVLNRRFYAFFLRQRGIAFTTAVLPLHVLYYLYSGAALLIGFATHRRAASQPAIITAEGERA